MWGLDEPISHFAVVFDNSIVFHSDLTGLHIQWFKTFLKTHEVVYELDYSPGLEQEEAIYQGVLNAYDGRGYDYGAFVYFAWRALLKKLFNKPMPEKNPLGHKDRYLCDEVVQLLPDEICPPALKQMDLAMKSPYQVWLLLNNKSL